VAKAATLTTLVFISKRLDAPTTEYRRWYIEHHAPDFLTFGRPYLRRYNQHYVDRAHKGAVDFDVISEFEYRDAQSRDALLKTVMTPEARAMLARVPKIGVQPGPNEAHDGPRAFAVDAELLSGPPRGYDRPATAKQALLLRRSNGASLTEFAEDARRFGSGMEAGRVVLDLALPEAGRPAPLFDGVMLVWPARNGVLPSGFGEPPGAVEVANILDILSYETDLGTL
jgi:hypothetical protein